ASPAGARGRGAPAARGGGPGGGWRGPPSGGGPAEPRIEGVVATRLAGRTRPRPPAPTRAWRRVPPGTDTGRSPRPHDLHERARQAHSRAATGPAPVGELRGSRVARKDLPRGVLDRRPCLDRRRRGEKSHSERQDGAPRLGPTHAWMRGPRRPPHQSLPGEGAQPVPPVCQKHTVSDRTNAPRRTRSIRPAAALAP